MDIDVKTTRGRVHIPQFVEAYIYDAANPREYVEFINRHVDLAKDCLCQEFLIDSYSIRVDNVFIEYECLQPAQAVKLLDGTGLTTRRRPAQQPQNIEMKEPVSTAFYFPIIPSGPHSPEFQQQAYVSVQNTISLFQAFAKIYGLTAYEDVHLFSQTMKKGAL